MFDRQTLYVENARQLQAVVRQARENTSREHFDDIVKIVNNEVAAAVVNAHKEELWMEMHEKNKSIMYRSNPTWLTDIY